MALKIISLDPVTVAAGNTIYPIAATPKYAASISLQADYNNSGRISIGGPEVTPDNGIQLAPGEAAVIEFPSSAKFTDEFDVSQIYVTAATSPQVVRVAIIKKDN